MTEVIVVDLQHVTIGGVSAGSLVSACANHADIATELEAAVGEWLKVYAAQSAKEATDRGEEIAAKLKADLDAAVAKVEELNAKLVELHGRYTADVQAMAADYNGKLAGLQDEANRQIQSLTTGNQHLTAELNMARRQIVSSFNLAQEAMTGSSESARAAAREWHAVDADALDAASSAKKAALAKNS